MHINRYLLSALNSSNPDEAKRRKEKKNVFNGMNKAYEREIFKQLAAQTVILSNNKEIYLFCFCVSIFFSLSRAFYLLRLTVKSTHLFYRRSDRFKVV